MLQHFFTALFVCFILQLYLNSWVDEKICKTKLLSDVITSVAISFPVLFVMLTIFNFGWDGSIVVYGKIDELWIVFLVIWNLVFIVRAIWLLERNDGVLNEEVTPHKVISNSIFFAFTWPYHLGKLFFQKKTKKS